MTAYESLTTRIRREMNGAVSGSMRLLSPKHQRKINFGVSIPTIKDICKEYTKSHELANELRTHDVREWWLASAFIDNPELITEEDANTISSQWINTEESDIFAMQLLYLIPDAMDVAKNWLTSSCVLRRNAAEKIIMRLAPKISYNEAETILNITSAEIPIRAIYHHHPLLRGRIRENGPYTFSWILDEIDNF